MPMSTKSFKPGNVAKRSSDNVTGAGIVSTPNNPEANVGGEAGTGTQSPASLKQPKQPSVVGNFTGAESNASTQK